MTSLALLFFGLGIMAISFQIPGIVLSPASVSGTALTAFLLFFIVSTAILWFRRQKA